MVSEALPKSPLTATTRVANKRSPQARAKGVMPGRDQPEGPAHSCRATGDL